MKRREFITLLGAAAALWPLRARAQTNIPVVGFLNSASTDTYALRARAFHQGLGELGYVEGHNVIIDHRETDGQHSRSAELVAELVRQRVSVIAVGGIPAALAAKAATTTIPIVFQSGGDPVELGLVASLNRPGGNLTGVGNLGMEVGPKRLELLHELVPAASTIVLLINPTNPNAETLAKDHRAAANLLGLQLIVLHASSDRDLDPVFVTLIELRAGALVIGNDGFFNSRSEQLAGLTLRHRVPAIYTYREFAAAGGLMSYGSSITDAYRLMGIYTGQILKGEKPGDLPVQQSTKVELIINLTSAKALGLAVPLSLLGRADEVIE
jgi:putative ABC transport system substrate-binding protein